MLTLKVVSQLLLPPGGLILLAMLGVLCWRHRWGRGLVVISMALLWALSTEPVRDALTQPLEFKYKSWDVHAMPNEAAAIVVLGGGIYANAPEYNGEDELRSYAMMRTLYASRIAQQTSMDIYATGGKPLLETDDAEAEVMKRWLLRLGVSEGRVFAESYANNTWQNAMYIKELLFQKGIHSIVLVTSAWHMPRSVWCFEKQGFRVIPAPTDYLTAQLDYDMRSFVPRWTVFEDSGQALHEYMGLFWYRMRYR